MDSVVRISLEKLNRPDRVFAIVRETRSVESASLVAKFCEAKGDIKNAVEFLLMAKRKEDAFRLARQHRCMDTYAKCLGNSGSQSDYVAIAEFFESIG